MTASETAISEVCPITPSKFPTMRRFLEIYDRVQLNHLKVEFLPDSAFHHGGRFGLVYDPDSSTRWSVDLADPSKKASHFLTLYPKLRDRNYYTEAISKAGTVSIVPTLGNDVKLPSSCRDDKFGTIVPAICWLTWAYENDADTPVHIGHIRVTARVKFIGIDIAADPPTAAPAAVGPFSSFGVTSTGGAGEQ